MNYQRAYDEFSFTPKITYDMAKNRDSKYVNNIVKNSDGSYTINYKIEFSLDKDKSNFPLKNFELRDFLDYGDIYTNSELLANGYVYYNRDSVKLYAKKIQRQHIRKLMEEITIRCGRIKVITILPTGQRQQIQLVLKLPEHRVTQLL